LVTDGSARTFMGHPKGLFYLAFTEAWERFSYYGMTALVVLYMVNQLLLPGHVEHIAGFARFRAFVESMVGPLSTQALASQIFGLYTGFVYFTPLLGGQIADRWIGQRNAVVIGALLMSGGHLAMASEQTFLLALLLLVVGSGLLKGNISAQVGALYPRNEEALRTRGFTVFSMAINVGAVTGHHSSGDTAFHHGRAEGSGVEVHEAFMHHRGALGQVRTQTDAIGVGDPHTCGNHVVNHARELVHAVNHHVAALTQARTGHFKTLDGGWAEVGPYDVGELAEDAIQVDAVGLDQTVRKEV